jgi:hypothetical protein
VTSLSAPLRQRQLLRLWSCRGALGGSASGGGLAYASKGVGLGWRSQQGALNTWSVVFDIAAIVVALIPGVDAVAPISFAASVATGAAATAIPCSHSWGSNECSTDMVVTIGGAVLGGAGVAATAAKMILEAASFSAKRFASGVLRPYRLLSCAERLTHMVDTASKNSCFVRIEERRGG